MSALRRPKNQVKLVLSILLLLGLVYVGYRWARSDALAVLSELSGGPYRDTKASMRNWVRAERGDEFLDGDGSKTPADTTAKFRLGKGAQLTLKPSSVIRFHRRLQGKGAIGLTVEVGEADLRTQQQSITIDSQFGPLTLSPDSQVSLTRKGKRLMLSVELGSLRLDSDLEVTAGQELTLDWGGIVVDGPHDIGDNLADPQELVEELEEELNLDRGDGVDGPDLVVPAGQSFVVHDPSPPTKIGFDFSELCAGPARVESDGRFTEALKRGALSFSVGNHKYVVRCLDESKGEFKAQLAVVRDAGMKQLPSFTSSASVATDGRRYTLLYAHRLPKVMVSWPTAPAAESYTLYIDGRAITTTAPNYHLSSGTLAPGTHQLSFAAATAPVRRSRTTTVVVRYDSQAPTARVQEPRNGFAPGSNVPVEGRVMPGWSVSLNGKKLSLDEKRRFATNVTAEGTLPVAFSHPEKGTHYYLRRPRAGQ